MIENLNNFADYTATIAGLMDERVKLVNDIRKGVDLTMNLIRLLRIRDTFQYIKQQIFWDYMLCGHCSESNWSELQKINVEIWSCNQELNSQINKAITDKIFEELAVIANRHLRNGYL